MMDAGRRPVRVLTPLSDENLSADRRAFAQVMRHLKEVDGDQHTVILVQVENEPGSLFTDRDYSPPANEKFAAPVPAKLVEALGRKPGTWKQVFGAEADESFAAYTVSRYVDAVA